MFSRTLNAQHPVSLRVFTSLPGSRLKFFIAMQIQYSYEHTYMYSSRLYAQNPVFEIVREESVKVYLHMYNGNVQQKPLCVESCVTKELPIFPQFSPTIFYRDADSVLLRAHLCTAVDSMRRTLVRKCLSRDREGLYNGNVQQNPLYAASCVTKSCPLPPKPGFGV